MKRLTSKTFNSSKGVHAHITEIKDLTAQLKTLKIDISEPFLVHFILNSLPAEYEPFKISYNTQKEEWSITELLTMCVQKEERMKHDKLEVAHLATRPKGMGKKYHGKRYMYLYLLNEKAEALDTFKSFKAEVEKQKDKKIKIVRSDRSGEYYGRYTENGQMSGPFAKFLESEDIVS
ncbi:hypothetical protein CRG98_029927 [Punica granatum]|uniref:Retrovirus-related Pol polyprotein from transposon TNT 1-94 n=1 Tax=Punica granatum TaxID=22663 RepID=A0A2I0J0D3_PUNGR|nr:hypothetical protein CRG98_029927 [Punica granatum]